MRIYAFRRTLNEFAQQARRGQVAREGAFGRALAELAEQLESRLSRAQSLNEIKSDDTISSSPGGCPCCGRS